MKIVSVEELYSRDYTLEVINGLRQYWRSTKIFNCINVPKAHHILLYLDGCSAEYLLKSGEKIFAKSGDLIYAPMGAEYKLTLYDFESEKSNTVGVNFRIFDEEGKPIAISSDVVVFDTDNSAYKYLMSEIEKYGAGNTPCYGVMKANLYRILSMLGEHYHQKSLNSDEYILISKGIFYLENDRTLELSVKQIAEMCNVSEVYFRRLFEKYSGESPAKYKLRRKINKARLYLEYENMSVSEIGECLGFVDTAYFIKMFKKYVGVTPLQYKQSLKKGDK